MVLQPNTTIDKDKEEPYQCDYQFQHYSIPSG